MVAKTRKLNIKEIPIAYNHTRGSTLSALKDGFMSKAKEFLYFYRVLNWEDKISGFRPLGYAFFGYAVAFSGFEFLPALLNTLGIMGILMFAYSLNDYYDYKLRGERNFLSVRVKTGGTSETKAHVYCYLPLLLLPCFLWGTPSSGILALVGLLLSWLYSLPPFRFKDRKMLGFVVFPLCTAVLFLQGSLLFGLSGLNIWMLAILIFLFHCYIESFHVVSDYVTGEKRPKLAEKKALRRLNSFPLLSIIVSLAFSFYNLFFLVTSIFAAVRVLSLRKANVMKNIQNIRTNIFTPIWSLYEFGIYALLAIFLDIFNPSLGYQLWKI